MKPLKTLFFLLLLVTSLQAQKIKLKDYKVTATYVNLPNIGFSQDIATYNTKVVLDEGAMSRFGMTRTDVSKRIGIGGYTRVEGGGNVTITMNLNAPTSTSRKLNAQDKEGTDKNKKKYKYKLYNYTHSLEVSASYAITDSKGNLLDEQALPFTEVLTTGEFKSLDALKKQYANDYPKKLNEARRNILNKCISEVNKKINRDYGMGTLTSKEHFESLKSKDHPDGPAFDKIKTVVEGAFAKMKAESNEEFIAAIQPAIDFWVEKEPTYSATDKKEKKLNFACRYNTALAYYWMDDMENAAKYATMVQEGDYKEKRGKSLNAAIAKVKAKMETLNRPSRHFKIKMSAEDEAMVLAFREQEKAAYASGDISKYPEFKSAMKVKMESHTGPGTLYYNNGNKVDGYFAYESDRSIPDFRFPNRIRFGYDESGNIEVGTMKYANLDSFQMNEQMFRIKDVTIGAGILSTKLKNAVMETVKPLGRTILEICHPPFKHAKGLGKDTELTSTLLIFHKEKKKYFTLDGLSSFTKQMSKVVEDCPTAVAYLEEKQIAKKEERKKKSLLEKLGDTNNNDEQMMEALRLYDECKK